MRTATFISEAGAFRFGSQFGEFNRGRYTGFEVKPIRLDRNTCIGYMVEMRGVGYSHLVTDKDVDSLN